MSVKIMSWIWENSPYDGSKLLLLLAIADSANDEGVAWPGLGYLARKTRLGRRYVIDLIKALENDNAIMVGRRREGLRNKSNVYKLVVPGSLVNRGALVVPNAPGSEPQTTTPSEPQTTRVVVPSSPYPLKKHHIEPKVNRKVGADAPPPPKEKTKKPKIEPDARLTHPALIAYREEAHLHVPVSWRDEVIQTVEDVHLWTGIVHDWIGSGWNKQNVRGMLDSYRAGGIQEKKGLNGGPGGRLSKSDLAAAALGIERRNNGNQNGHR